MKVVVLAVGKPKDKRILAMAEEYLERVRPDGIPVEYVSDIFAGSPADRIEREGQELLRRIRPRDRLLLLGENGEEYDSPSFAGLLSREMETTEGRVVLAIGGPWGTSVNLRRRSGREISLSRMTFPHELCFLFLAEQLCRAFSILRGSGYHHY
jgi:23S rRNA (pseudouridine1915-N3)-methyltransferase